MATNLTLINKDLQESKNTILIKVDKTDFQSLGRILNEIGWENILQIIPSAEFNTTLYTIIHT